MTPRSCLTAAAWPPPHVCCSLPHAAMSQETNAERGGGSWCSVDIVHLPLWPGCQGWWTLSVFGSVSGHLHHWQCVGHLVGSWLEALSTELTAVQGLSVSECGGLQLPGILACRGMQRWSRAGGWRLPEHVLLGKLWCSSEEQPFS